MRRKINIQLIGISILAIAATMVMMLIIFYDLFSNQVQDDLRSTATILKSADIFHEDAIGSYHLTFHDLRITWIATDGTVLYDNDADVGSMDNHLDRPEVETAFQKGSGEAVRNSSTLNKSTFYYALRLDDGSVLRVAKEASSPGSVVGNMIPLMAAMILVMIVIGIILAHFLTKSLIEPIEEMAKNLDDYAVAPAYKELVPFVTTIRNQHADILKSANMRQNFTANVSHELKTPLTAISGYAELMENNMVSPDEIPEFSNKIRRNAERLLSLINDIIRLSELDVLEDRESFENFDLFDLADRCVENLKMYARKHDVTISCRGTATPVCGNKDMLSELITNLCDNAIRYNYKNGTVAVSVGAMNGRAYFRVKDSGIGIPEQSQERIFERFYRVDKSRSKQTGGTGLGLAIVKHIVEIHDAQLKLESEPGKGTTIMVIFKL